MRYIIWGGVSWSLDICVQIQFALHIHLLKDILISLKFVAIGNRTAVLNRILAFRHLDVEFQRNCVNPESMIAGSQGETVELWENCQTVSHGAVHASHQQ